MAINKVSSKDGSIQLYNGDCLEIMSKHMKPESIDAVICDLPYGTTNNVWDIRLEFDRLWECYHRVGKPNCPFILFGAKPFSAELIISNLNEFKYDWIWEKSKATGFLNAKKMPLRAHEEILVFYRKPPTYNPQKTEGKPYNNGSPNKPTGSYGKFEPRVTESKDGTRYPRSVFYYKTAESEGEVFHDTQKPLGIVEMLVKTYTNEGDTVLDNCMGSGTTGLACRNNNRKFIGIELWNDFFEISRNRIFRKTIDG